MLPQFLDQLDPERQIVFKRLKPFRKLFDDLTAHKAYTIGRRNAWRDYVDLFILLKWNLYSLEKVIELAEKKFSEFNDKLFLQQLIYFKDIDPVKTIFLKESYSNEEIKTYLEKSVSNYLHSHLPI